MQFVKEAGVLRTVIKRQLVKSYVSWYFVTIDEVKFEMFVALQTLVSISFNIFLGFPVKRKMMGSSSEYFFKIASPMMVKKYLVSLRVLKSVGQNKSMTY
jgi:hypothetical protein